MEEEENGPSEEDLAAYRALYDALEEVSENPGKVAYVAARNHAMHKALVREKTMLGLDCPEVERIVIAYIH